MDNLLQQKKITLLVGGSIAAYKSAELVREFVKAGAEVHVVMSKAATEFISPLTLQSLSGKQVTTDLFDVVRESQINHIWLADSADVVLAAPATADFLAKAAAGIADDSATTVLLATKAPIIYAPAMNVNMWQNPLTQRNVAALRALGHHVVEPESGELACGWVGEGRLAELDAIMSSVRRVLSRKDLVGERILVTAGPTRAVIDPVRFISNRSSGKMGYAIAEQARLRGAEVTLVSGPTSLRAPYGVNVQTVVTAAEMREKVFEHVLSKGGDPKIARQFVFMAAAVTDHMPAEPASTKLKHDKGKGYSISMVPCPDILNELGERRAEISERSGQALKLVGFAAESGSDQEIVGWTQGKLERKHVDLMVGNSIEEAFGNDTNRVWLLDKKGGQQEIPHAEKSVIADRIIDAALKA